MGTPALRETSLGSKWRPRPAPSAGPWPTGRTQGLRSTDQVRQVPHRLQPSQADPSWASTASCHLHTRRALPTGHLCGQTLPSVPHEAPTMTHSEGRLLGLSTASSTPTVPARHNRQPQPSTSSAAPEHQARLPGQVKDDRQPGGQLADLTPHIASLAWGRLGTAAGEGWPPRPCP